MTATVPLRGRSAPVDLDFRTWATDHVGAEAADALGRSAGILTYFHDPGELSAAFVWDPLVRGLLSAPPTARYPIGGWSTIVEQLRERAVAIGVSIETGIRVEELPAPVPVSELLPVPPLLGFVPVEPPVPPLVPPPVPVPPLLGGVLVLLPPEVPAP